MSVFRLHYGDKVLNVSLENREAVIDSLKAGGVKLVEIPIAEGNPVFIATNVGFPFWIQEVKGGK